LVLVLRKKIKLFIFIILLPLIAEADVIYPLGGLRFENRGDLRIVSTAPSITETLYFLGLFDNIIAVTRYDDFPEGVKEKEMIGGYLDIDVEKILRLRPDIVFCEPNSGIKSSVELLVVKRIPVYVVNIGSVLDILIAIEEMGKILCKEEEARRLLNELYKRYIRLQGLLSKNNNSALIVINENPLMVAGNKSFVGELLGLSGFKNAYQGEYKYPVLDNETLLLLNPNIVINVSESVMAGDENKDKDSSKILKSFFKDDTKFYNISDTVFIRPSPRFMEALESLCSLNSQYYCH
jgi:iron complex transport system substrate-binding protein